MRSIHLVVLPTAVALFGCTATSDVGTPEGDEDVATESTAEAVSITSTPGKAVWTKVYRSYSTATPTRATDVAVDENGESYVTRTKRTINDDEPSSSEVDVTRYSPTGALI